MLEQKYLLKKKWNASFLSNCDEKEFQLFFNTISSDKIDFINRKNKAFEEVYKILNSLSCPVFVTGGTLLGIIRDNSLIPWDDDIDMDMLEEDYNIWSKIIFEELIKRDCVVRIKDNEGFPKMRIYSYGIKISIDSLILSNNKRIRPAYNYPDIFFKNSEIFRYKNIDLKIPGPPQDFLKYVYGKNWNIPIQSDNDYEYMSSKVMNKNPIKVYLVKFLLSLKSFFLKSFKIFLMMRCESRKKS